MRVKKQQNVVAGLRLREQVGDGLAEVGVGGGAGTGQKSGAGTQDHPDLPSPRDEPGAVLLQVLDEKVVFERLSRGFAGASRQQCQLSGRCCQRRGHEEEKNRQCPE